MVYKIAIIGYVILYIGVALFVRSMVLYKNTGINPFKTMGKAGIKGINERVLILGSTFVPIIALIYLLPNDAYDLLVPITYLETIAIKNVGLTVMILGSLIGIVSQFQMGNSWRIGINENEKTKLVTSNLFKYSRNPIYLGLLISFLGYFLLVPNALSLSCLALSYPSLEIKIRLEEQYLLDQHGDQYQRYINQVNRWV